MFRVTIRDVDAIVSVDRETTEASESVGDHLEWRKRADRGGRRGHRPREDRQQERRGERLRHGVAWRKSRATPKR